jgi:hypothetical protein
MDRLPSFLVVPASTAAPETSAVVQRHEDSVAVNAIRRIGAAVAVIVAAATAFCEEPGYNFRHTRWGMTEQQVRQVEGDRTVHETSEGGLRSIAYRGRVGDKKCYITYLFAESLLVRGKFVLTEHHTDESLYLEDFEEIKRALTKDFGEPLDKVEWRSDDFRHEPDRWGMAVAAGHLSLSSKWHTKDTVITATISGGALEITIEVEYSYKIRM